MKPLSYSRYIVNSAVIVAALGYFVDIYDLLLFGIVRTASLTELGMTGELNRNTGEFLLSMQMYGMLVGGILWGILGDKKGRISVLFGSILTYSLANIFNGMVQTVEGYAICRLVAGIGLAGELGAGITLVAETLPKEKRGYGTMIVASVGILGAVVANLVYQSLHDWRLCYYAGGGLGMLLLILRVSVSESGMFLSFSSSHHSKGNFFSLLTTRTNLIKYARCIFIGIPIWFIIGVLITFSPEFANALGVIDSSNVAAGQAIAWSYSGLVIGDICSGMLSQILHSRKKVMYVFLALSLGVITLFLNSYNVTLVQFYWLCFFLGLTSGYWVIFVTIAAEQFGTNIRATVTTTTPNFVRGALPIIIIVYQFFRDSIFSGDILMASMVVAIILSLISFIALWGMKETFSVDLNYAEEV